MNSVERASLILAFQESCRNSRFAAQIYLLLSESETREFTREILLMLAKNSQRSAADYATRLLRLGESVPPEVELSG